MVLPLLSENHHCILYTGKECIPNVIYNKLLVIDCLQKIKKQPNNNNKKIKPRRNELAELTYSKLCFLFHHQKWCPLTQQHVSVL